MTAGNGRNVVELQVELLVQQLAHQNTDVVSSVNCFHNILPEAVGSHNYQHTYSLLFNLQGVLLFPLTDVPIHILSQVNP
jgi:hypothetical protein